MSDKNVTNINSNNITPPITPSSVRVRSNGKKHSIDDIIDHMTADLQSYEGQYIVLGSPQNNPQHIWSEYNSNTSSRSVTAANQAINHGNQPAPVAQVQVSQVVGNHPIFLQQSAPPQQPYELHDRNIDFQTQQCGGLFYTSPTRVQDSSCGAGNGGEMIGMVDVGGGNFVNVVFNTTGSPHGQLHPQYATTANILPQHQTAIPTADNPPSTINYIYQQHQQPLNNSNQIRDYGLFNKETNQPNPPTQQPNRQLIENLVGNWLPNQSGTYSPFGGIAGRSSLGVDNGDNMGTLLSHNIAGTNSSGINSNITRKPRAVAEVRPMRPTYSDVLTKSPPPISNNTKVSSSSSSNATLSGNSTPKSDSRKHNNKTNKSGGNKENCNNSKSNSSTLRRQHSGGSDDNSSGSRLMSNIHKWMSIEELTPPQSGSEQSYDPHLLDDSNVGVNFDNDGLHSKREKKQKKRSTKQKVDEKLELLNNEKIGGIGFFNNSNNHNNNNNNSNVNNNSSNGSSSSKRSFQINSNLSRNRLNNEKNLSKSSKKGITKEDSKIGLGSMSGSKRSQRSGKRRNCQTYIGMLWNKWQHYMLLFALWFINLLWDVLALSSRLFIHLIAVSFEYSLSMLHCTKVYIRGIFGNKTNKTNNFNNSNSNSNNGRYKGGQHEHTSGSSKRSWWKFWDRNKKPVRPEKPHTTGGLSNNMAIPTTGDEAITRLLSCKGKDPYSILGVTRHCSDDDIKKYYKRQAVLVHPDKNSQPGAEEAFKILVHAFELIGEPERRSRYDHCVAETHQMEHAWTELNDLLTQLHQKMEYTANTIRCTNCGKRHRRVPVQRPCYAARFCAQCKIRHSAREGDIWAESWIMGFFWHYYACMESQIYNITEWATCQADNLQHLKANGHAVQYRIVLGKQQQNQHEPQHSQQQTPTPQQPPRQSEPDLEDFLNNLYSQSNGNNMNQGSGESNTSKHRRKTKRKK